MKSDYRTIVGICLIILVFAGPARSGEDGRTPDPNVNGSYSWINPDGSRGDALPQLSLATVRSWVNPDGIRGILDEVEVGRVGSLDGDFWVNPDGFRGSVNKPMLGARRSAQLPF